jgi:predicted Zn-dependent protease with MMP-like domain
MEIKGQNWRDTQAPTLAEIETLADDVFASLPSEFRKVCDGLVIKIDDFPSAEIIDSMDCETEFDLLGLFSGCGLAQGENFAVTGQFPNMIWLYRRPILDYWAEHEESLGKIIEHVLIHEIGHHFGLSDEDMHAIEKSA